MSGMRYCSAMLITAIAIVLLGGPVAAQPRAPQPGIAIGGMSSSLLDVMLLLRLARLQLSREQIDAILQVCQQQQAENAAETMQQLEALRQRLLRGEQPQAADLQLLRQASRALGSPGGDDPKSKQTIQMIEALLTPEQLAMLTEGFAVWGRRQADSGAALAVFTALSRIMKETDATKRQEQAAALVKAVGEAGGAQIDEAAIQDLQEFCNRVLAMDRAEFTEDRQELLTELGVVVPPKVDVGKLYLALEPERVHQQIRFLLMTEQAQRLLQEMREARAEE